MTADVANLVYKLIGDARSLEATLAKVEKETKTSTGKNVSAHKKANKQIEDSYKAMSKTVTSVLAAAGIAKYYNEIVKAASDAQEAMNKSRAVFSSINDEAIAMANNLSNFYGLSKTAALDSLTDTGNLLTNFGLSQDMALQFSVQLTQLGVDLASFVNYSAGAEAATHALTKALIGEREAAKALGLAITENDVKNMAEQMGFATSELTRQEKALATLQVMLNMTANAQGDFARSQHDYANQLRVLSASWEDLKLVLGEQIIPLFQMAVGSLTSLIDTVAESGEVVQWMLVTLPALALAIKGVTMAVVGLQNATITGKILLGITALVTAIGTVATLIQRAEDKTRDFAGASNDLTNTLKDYNSILATKERLQKKDIDSLTETEIATLSLAEAQHELAKARMSSEVQNLNLTYKNQLEYLDELSAKTDKLRGQESAFNTLMNIDGNELEERISSIIESSKKAPLDSYMEGYLATLEEYYTYIKNGNIDISGLMRDQELASQATLDSIVKRQEVELEMQTVIDNIARFAMQDKDNHALILSLLGEENEVWLQIEESIAEITKDMEAQDKQLNSIAYGTKDWADQIAKIEKANKDLEISAMNLNKAEIERIKLLEQERDLRLKEANEQKTYLEETGQMETEAYEQVKQDIENIATLHELEVLEIKREFAEERLELEKEVAEGIEALNDKLYDSDKDRLSQEIRDLRKERDEILQNILKTSGMSDEALKLAEAMALSGADVSMFSKEMQEMVEAYKLYLANKKKLEDDYAAEQAEEKRKQAEEQAEEELKLLEETNQKKLELQEMVSKVHTTSPYDPLIGSIDLFKDSLATLEEAYENDTLSYEEYLSHKEELTRNSVAHIVDQTLSLANSFSSQLGSLISDAIGLSVSSEETLLQAYQDQKKHVEEEAKDSGRELTKSEKDELERRGTLLDEQIEQQTQKVKEEKQKQFEINKAFSIAEATITGVQATLNAFTSLSKQSVVAAGIVAGLTASFTAAQIAIIASTPMPSYAVGAYDLPQDQIAQVHKGEMIIPRPFAEEIRGGGLGGGEININVYGATEDVSVEEKESGEVRQLDIYLTSRVKQMVQRGELDNSLQTRYQISRNGRRG